MVGLNQFREYMKTQAEKDRQKKTVQVTGANFDEALRQAVIELDLPLKKIEYEILEKGSKGTLGFGKKDCILIAYEAVQKIEKPEEDELGLDFEIESPDEQEPIDKNGEVYVKLAPDGVYLKVTPAVRKGHKVTEKLAFEKLDSRAVHKYNRPLVSKVVKQADSQFIRVGEFIYNPANDSIMSVDIKDYEMKAYIIVRSSGPGGADFAAEIAIAFLKNNDIINGIKEDVLNEFENHPRYDASILVAEGSLPVNGNDARIIYNFDLNHSEVNLKEKNGRVDFKEMNLVQNVVEGQSLARKIPFEEGIDGRTVTGKILPANAGKDIEIGIGKNVKLSEDGITAFATINGQVLLSNDKLNVEPVYVVPGNVNLKTGGNIIFLGTVIVKGSVDDGFKVKAAGNIEVMGNVGKSELDAEGEIIVYQGITGKSGGEIKCGKSVWAKFIENATIEAGEMVIASDGIINSNVNANERIICQGKRATIVGGHLRTAEEIHAKTLGSISGSETLLEVGYDPKSKAKIISLENKIEEINLSLEEVDLNINTLNKIKKVKGVKKAKRTDTDD